MAVSFLRLIENHPINEQVGVQVTFHTFLTPERDSGVWLVSFSVQALYP